MLCLHPAKSLLVAANHRSQPRWARWGEISSISSIILWYCFLPYLIFFSFSTSQFCDEFFSTQKCRQNIQSFLPKWTNCPLKCANFHRIAPFALKNVQCFWSKFFSQAPLAMLVTNMRYVLNLTFYQKVNYNSCPCP